MFGKSAPVALIMCAGMLAGCASDEVIEVTEGFFGAVATDEPRAAVVAQDTLVSGGRAADAAVSAFFTLAVTLPSSAGLSSSGACLVFDPESERYERLTFPAVPLSDDANAIAAPIAPRAMFALHARYGSVPFTQLIGGAEQLARFGETVSRRLAEDIGRDGAVLREVSAGRSELLAPSGGVLGAGEPLVQFDLALTLGRLRITGVGDLYSGQLSRRFTQGARSLGYNVDPSRLRRAVPSWSPVNGFEHGNHIWAVAASRAIDQGFLAKSLALALNEAGWSSAPTSGEPALIAGLTTRAANAVAHGDTSLDDDALEQLFDDYERAGPQTPVSANAAAFFGGTARSGATSFTITDRRGQTVGCAFSMQTPFGTGQVLPELGFLAAPAQGSGVAPLAAAVVAGNTNAWQMHMSAMAAGGRPVVSALLPSVARHFQGGHDMVSAVAAPRSHYDLGSDQMLIESDLSKDAENAASAAGYRVRSTAEPLAAVRMFRCNGGLPRGETDCGVADDARGRGLILFEEEE